jgi:Arc/MetJ-type ribon-helix-helix transcriptional regulator
MTEILIKTKVDEFLAQRVERLIKNGVFKDEEEFLKDAIKEMLKKCEIRNLNKKMDDFAHKMEKKHPRSLSETLFEIRTEEDDEL